MTEAISMAGFENQVFENKEVTLTQSRGGTVNQKDVKNERCSG
jgi:hypothetical protein